MFLGLGSVGQRSRGGDPGVGGSRSAPCPPAAFCQLGGGGRNQPWNPKKCFGGSPRGSPLPFQLPFEQLRLIGLAAVLQGKNGLSRLWLFLLITNSPSRPSAPLAHGEGPRVPLSAERGPGSPACREGSAGVQPICCSSISLVLPVPSPGGRGSGSVPPGRPVSSTGGRTKGGWQAVKWLPVGQPCRLPALPAPATISPLPRRLPELCRSSRLRPPPQQSCCSLCRQLLPPRPPASAGSRNQTPSGPDAVFVAERCLRRQRGSLQPALREAGVGLGSRETLETFDSAARLRCSPIPEQHRGRRQSTVREVLCSEAPSRALRQLHPRLPFAPAQKPAGAEEVQPVVCRDGRAASQLSPRWVTDAR
ncbi:uncharacterized protein [Ciconia boyciana]|uniref:uncharacterized protein n=1 Tax=Ciconia boyciana TaxID=52775 RepID=UPI003BA28F04